MNNVPDFSNAMAGDTVYLLTHKSKFEEVKIVEKGNCYITIAYKLWDRPVRFLLDGRMHYFDVTRLFWKPFDIPEQSLVKQNKKMFIRIKTESTSNKYGYYRIKEIIPGTCNELYPPPYSSNNFKNTYIELEKDTLRFIENGESKWSIYIGSVVNSLQLDDIKRDIQKAKDCFDAAMLENKTEDIWEW